MPNISRPGSSEPAGRVHRIAVIALVLLLTAIAVLALSRTNAAGGGQAHVVVIENMKFSPDVLRLPLGDRVVFQNHDLFPHTATAKADQPFDSGPLKSGEEWTYVPIHAGTIHFACTFHPVMTGSIIVGTP